MLLPENVNRRMREYIIWQMLNFLRFLLAVNNIADSETKTFDEVCAEERELFITEKTHESARYFYDLDNLYIPNYNCLWDLIFNTLGQNNQSPYTPILSAYCRSNNITTKTELYITMSAELENWVDTIDQLDDIVIILIGMVQNREIYHTFSAYTRIRYGFPDLIDLYQNILDALFDNNFENIDPDSYEIKPYIPIQIKYTDPLQQVFYKYIIRSIDSTDPTELCDQISRTIYYRFNIIIQIQPTDNEKNIIIKNISQMRDYCESKIPQYPAEIKDHLSVLTSINGFITWHNKFANLAKMAELSEYNLRNLPIIAIMGGLRGATPIDKIPLEEIPEYYARLTYSYSGKHTKPARI